MSNSIATYVWPGQTRVGSGAARLAGKEAKARRRARAFILTDPGVEKAGLLEPVTISLAEAGLSQEVYRDIPGNPDVASVDAAGAACVASEADLILAVGGGSVIDAAKGVRILAGDRAHYPIGEYALRLGNERRPNPQPAAMPPMIAVPTTAGTGAEVTPWGVLTDPDQQLKFSVGGPDLMPDVALLDPDLTLSLPRSLTAATGLDALAHLIEAYVSTNQNSALDPLILHGIGLIGRSLRTAVIRPDNLAARHDMILAAMLGGIAISSNWLGACHSLAHQLSSFADLHHGVAIALMLPHQMAFSLSAALERYGQIGAALEALEPSRPANMTRRAWAEQAVIGVRALIADIGLPTRLSDLGISDGLLPAMADHAYNFDVNWMTNPCLVSQADLEAIYRQAL